MTRPALSPLARTVSTPSAGLQWRQARATRSSSVSRTTERDLRERQARVGEETPWATVVADEIARRAGGAEFVTSEDGERLIQRLNALSDVPVEGAIGGAEPPEGPKARAMP